LLLICIIKFKNEFDLFSKKLDMFFSFKIN